MTALISPEYEAARAEFRAFVAKEIAPHADEFHRARTSQLEDDPGERHSAMQKMPPYIRLTSMD